MITEALLNIFFGALDIVMGFIPIFNFSFDHNALQTFFDIVKSVSYLLPMDTIGSIFSIIVNIVTFRVVVATIKTVWALIPIL